MARRSNKKTTIKARKTAAASPVGMRTSPATLNARKSSGGGQIVLLSLILFLVVLFVFEPCVDNKYVNYDDNEYVVFNGHVKQGLTAESIVWAFKSGDQANWHPLTWLSHMLDCQFYGLKPAGHHFTSVLLHSINVSLLFLTLYLMTGARWKCVAVAALFGLHPLRVESVAWIAERKDVLSAAFWLLTIWAYVRFAQTLKTGAGFRRFYGLGLLFFVLGLLSKPMVVTLPFVLLLLDYWPLRRFENRNWRIILLEKIPYFVLSAISSVITYKVQQRGGAMLINVPFSMRFQTALISYFQYLGKMIWPAGLSIFYPYPSHWPVAAAVSSAMLLAAISLAAVVYRKKLPWLGVGWLWYVGVLVPVIGLVQVGMQSMADRYTYLPCIGIMIILVWGASEIWHRWRLPDLALAVIFVFLLVACALRTRQEIKYWQDEITVFSHAAKVTTHNELAYEHASYRLFNIGERDAAIQMLEQAIKEMPDSAALFCNLGMFYKEQEHYAEAEVQFREALRLQPVNPEAQVGLAYICLKDGRHSEAVSLLKQALRSQPDLQVAQKMLRQATSDTPQ